jgi:hypothetical protein
MYKIVSEVAIAQTEVRFFLISYVIFPTSAGQPSKGHFKLWHLQNMFTSHPRSMQQCLLIISFLKEYLSLLPHYLNPILTKHMPY